MNIIDRIREEIDKLRIALPWGACSAQKEAEALFKDEAYKEVMDALDRIVPQSGDGAPAQIDDEKTYRALVDRIYSDVNELIKGADKRLYLELFEKQKERSQEELVYRLNGLMQEYIKEGKDDAEKEHRFKCYQLFWDALEDADFFEQQEQKPAWSEEDKRILKGIIGKIDHDQTYGVSKAEMLSFLKSLRPSWKPSKEQMSILKAVKEHVGRGSGYWGEGLGSLIKDLEKLI